MSGLEFNKIVAAILISSIVAMLTGFVANILYKPELELENRGYRVHTASSMIAEHTAEKPEKKEIDIGALMAQANMDAGKRLLKKCIACHTVNEGGKNRVGPNLWGIVGSKHGHKSDFKYSKAMINSGGVWDRAGLFAFLEKPKKYIPGTKMAFGGLKKPQDIANLVLYLESLK